MVPPGEYTVSLEVDDKEYSQNLAVLKDPHAEGTEADIRVQTEMLFDLWEDMNQTAAAINRIEWIRRQLYDLKAVVADLGDAEGIESGAEELDGTFVALEEKLTQMKTTDTGQDRVRWPTMLAGKIAYLASAVAVADFPPTDQHRQVHEVLRGRLDEYQEELESLVNNELAAFNKTLEEHELPRVVTGQKPETD